MISVAIMPLFAFCKIALVQSYSSAASVLWEIYYIACLGLILASNTWISITKKSLLQ
jgi:hypothetical protein